VKKRNGKSGGQFGFPRRGKGVIGAMQEGRILHKRVIQVRIKCKKKNIQENKKISNKLNCLLTYQEAGRGKKKLREFRLTKAGENTKNGGLTKGTKKR